MYQCHIMLGKIGDILSILPVIKWKSDKEKKPMPLVVSKQYADIVSNLDYVEPDIVDCHWQDLEWAMKYAKRKYDSVVVPQTYGKTVAIQHRTPSFQYDQWQRAGALEHWDKLPLEIPRPNEKDFANRFTEGRRSIFFADKGESSPFGKSEDLLKCLAGDFSNHKIIRSSEIVLDRFADFTAIYDACDLVVVTETAHLHLSKATQTPVVALVTDSPQRWHGSAWSDRFRFYCRYSDYPSRRDDLIDECKRCVNGEYWNLSKMRGEFENKFGYNMSMAWVNGVMFTTHRYHPRHNDWMTRIAINDGVMTSDVIFPSEFDEVSHEDARLFLFRGKLMISYVLSRAGDGFFRCVIGYAELVKQDGKWRIKAHIQPKFMGNDFTGMSKNWCPFVYDGKLHFIWGVHKGEQIIIEVDGESVVAEHRSKAPEWGYGEVRGGAIVNRGGDMLRFFHSRTDRQDKSFTYHIGASVMDSKPPFATRSISRKPIVSGDERYTRGCFHWKPEVAIVYGAEAKKRKGNPDGYLISVGRNDCRCEIIDVKEENLNL